ncbi:Amino acid/amide ABC transporter membrane protein 2, HAAT family [Bosea sp. 62]|uniref:branched-chain amino acid ABC transporter permease n=1 Tax=unclassified Bosea (in: a-proteobacteria) TaxID=2653178 RepID=UPI001254687B|nr:MULTISPECIES: branched-chain amino acid ABC transporter permease [unclassified Bosea (in: a-proteobacteria)]CAD5290424.1 Amino acid/amide ABC transporter membrane protein 2, HAAT family [Bosea sp. 7B]CAD5300123.1 Amino acid/amide ABC transporter membrane protein 2, HAAT family [Bosea sp. 21B]CAD5300572.1 Amino acid/amide ABC transporter membrane protein 2, HAAT family [Bosea sp. 46]VVT61859.1 Amino acid/amide ABC transporter membrane protein 2, HAAT family [Bosea sp. EC-HK365B]VXB44156.1 Am
MSATTTAEVTSVVPPRERAKVLLPAILFLLLALLPLAVSIGMPAGWLALLTRALIFAIAALSLDLILGVGGLVSFGHAAFLGIGAYVTGIMITEGRSEALAILPVILAVCALFGAITGAVCLRTRGVAFIMITLAFGQMVYFLAQALSAYGGDDGLTLYEKSTLLGFNPFANRTSFYYSVLIALAGAYLLVRGLVASRFGRVLRAARENPVRVSVTGFDVTKVRLVAYVISGMLAGLSGFFLANHTEFVSPAFMSWQRSGELIFMAVLGGVGSLHGAIIGAIAYLIAEDALSHLTEHWRVIFGPMIILFVLFTRGGIVGLLRKLGGRHG